MTYSIKIDPATFSPGGLFVEFAAIPGKVRIPLGNGFEDGPVQPLDVVYSMTTDREESRPGTLMITANTLTMTDTLFGKLNNFFKASLANYVTKGAIIVAKDGVAQTPVQIIT